jgi:hypothetical protein
MRLSFHSSLRNQTNVRGVFKFKRRLRFEELETRNMLAASPIDVAVTVPTAAAVPASPTVIGAAVVLTSSVLSTTGAAPLIANQSAGDVSTVTGVNSTGLPVILAFGQNALPATEVPGSTADIGMPTPWSPTLGMVTTLSQSLGGVPMRTESLASGPLGSLQPLSRTAHGMLPESNAGGENPGAPTSNPADNDPYNLLGESTIDPDAIDEAVLELVSLPNKIASSNDDLQPGDEITQAPATERIEPVFW